MMREAMVTRRFSRLRNRCRRPDPRPRLRYLAARRRCVSRIVGAVGPPLARVGALAIAAASWTRRSVRRPALRAAAPRARPRPCGSPPLGRTQGCSCSGQPRCPAEKRDRFGSPGGRRVGSNQRPRQSDQVDRDRDLFFVKCLRHDLVPIAHRPARDARGTTSTSRIPRSAPGSTVRPNPYTAISTRAPGRPPLNGTAPSGAIAGTQTSE